MAVVAIALGVALLGFASWVLLQRNSSRFALDWEVLDRIDATWERAGLGGQFLTRGFYVNAVALISAGGALITGGAAQWRDEPLWFYATIAFIVGFALVSLVAIVVVRTGRPASWIPSRYRSEAREP